MAHGVFIGNSDKSQKVENIYLGVNGVAQKIKKGYIGVNGVAQQFYPGYVWNRYNAVFHPEVTTYYWNKYNTTGGLVFNRTLDTDWIDGLSYEAEDMSQIYKDLNVNTATFDMSTYKILSGYSASIDYDRWFYQIDKGDGFYYISYGYRNSPSSTAYQDFYFNVADYEQYTSKIATWQSSQQRQHGNSFIFRFTYNLYDIKFRQGSLVGEISSTTSSAYPNNGVAGNYWYVYTKEETTPSYYSQGSYIDQVESTESNTYPTNGYQGGYWYVAQF